MALLHIRSVRWRRGCRPRLGLGLIMIGSKLVDASNTPTEGYPRLLNPHVET